MASRATPATMKHTSSWGMSSAGDSAQNLSIADSAESQDKTQSEPYQSRLAEIDEMISASYSKNAANKVRHGKQYRAVRKASIAQSKGEEVDLLWLYNEEANLWYAHSKDCFPGDAFPIQDRSSAWDAISNHSSTSGESSAWDISHLNLECKVKQISRRFDGEIQDYVSSSDSDTGGAKLAIDWDVFKTAYIQTQIDDKSASATSPSADTKSPTSSTGESDKENIDVVTKKEEHAQVADGASSIFNGVLPHATKKVTFNKAKPMSLASFVQEETNLYSSAAKLNGSVSTHKAARNHSSIRYADMKSTSTPHVKASKPNLQRPSANLESRVAISQSALPEYPSTKPDQAKSHTINSGFYGQLDGADDGKYNGGRERDSSIPKEIHNHKSSTQTRRRGNSRVSVSQPATQVNGWIEFRNSARLSPPTTAKHFQTTANKVTAEKDAKKAAALKAWANFPAQAAKEDREAAAAYEAPVTLGLATTPMVAAPAIKETYKKVVVSNTFERKVIEKRVDILE